MFVDQFRCGLLPYPGDPGEVVGRVAAKGGVVDVLVGGDAVSLLEPVGIGHDGIGDATSRVHHGDAWLDQLESVPISGNDDDLPPLFFGAVGDGGEHVVCLVAGDAHLADLHRREHIVDQRELTREQVGGPVALRLVLRVRLRAERRSADIPRDDHGVWGLVAEQLDQHGGESVDGVGHLTRGGRQVTGEGVESPISEAVSIE